MEHERYQGTWYEIAKYPKFFERKCDTAIAVYKYKPRKHGIDIINKCYHYDNGKLTKTQQIHGFASITETPFTLKLKFDHIPMSSNYIVQWTDYDNYAIVGHPGGWLQGNLWILARKPVINKRTLNALLNRA